MSTCFTCGTWPCSCCSTCAPSNTIYQGECTDPGSQTTGKYLAVLDYKFCEGRLAGGTGGVLQNRINGSGNQSIYWTNDVVLDPDVTQGAETTAFGNLLILSPDNHVRQLEGPVSAGLFLQTNATGDVVFGDPPAATVPDPLVVNDLTVANEAEIEDLVVNSGVELNGIVSGTVVNLLGLNATNQLVLQAVAQGMSVSMFFESATSPSASKPNETKVNGGYLVIGNRLFDSGADNIAVTTSEALTVQDAGTYVIIWTAQGRTGGGAALYGVYLEINGVIVNQGNGRTSGITAVGGGGAPLMWPMFGADVRTYAAGDVIKLQLSETASVVETYEVRLVAIKLPTT